MLYIDLETFIKKILALKFHLLYLDSEEKF